ncbi:chalcone isomerase family protein [Solimicrobium silvestre]|uniref:Chalcone-flavanone isomerase n=1 Tax=Solimicrobium silvestre TaxID=2099400 RepID=A0A2S9H5A4_9BURK|nr:chalcone isomerase family protein [Solimicrobium silvestre]PRC95169.1 Chalcone-flavanone isomerase [Solimicrobium silvestre]
MFTKFYGNFALSITLLLCPFIFSNHAFAVDVFGIKVPESVTISNQELVLNGAGIRTKFSTKYAVASLYLHEKKTTVDDVIALSGSKRLCLVLMKSSSSDYFAEGFITGIRNNATREEREKVFSSMAKFGQLFSIISDFQKGDIVTIDWIPNKGIVFAINDKQLGESINDQLFYSLFLKIWLGDHPLDSSLKRALLSGH